MAPIGLAPPRDVALFCALGVLVTVVVDRWSDGAGALPWVVVGGVLGAAIVVLRRRGAGRALRHPRRDQLVLGATLLANAAVLGAAYLATRQLETDAAKGVAAFVALVVICWINGRHAGERSRSLVT